MQTIAANKKANYDFTIKEKWDWKNAHLARAKEK